MLTTIVIHRIIHTIIAIITGNETLLISFVDIERLTNIEILLICVGKIKHFKEIGIKLICDVDFNFFTVMFSLVVYIVIIDCIFTQSARLSTSLLGVELIF